MTDNSYATFSVTVEANADWDVHLESERDPANKPEQGTVEDYKGFVYRLCKANYLVMIPHTMSHMYAEIQRLEKQVQDLQVEIAQAGQHA